MRGGLSNLNPLALAPIQLGMGKRAFDQRGVQEGGLSYMMDQLSLPQELWNTAQDIPGVPGEGEDTIIDKIANNDWMGVLSERFMGGGIPIRRVPPEQQLQQHNTNFDMIVEQQLRDFNYSQDTYRVTPTDERLFPSFSEC